MRTYLLSPAGRAVTWAEWESMGGCGLPGLAAHQVSAWIGLPISRWGDITLGRIGAAWRPANRALARFAVEHLGKPHLAVSEPMSAGPASTADWFLRSDPMQPFCACGHRISECDGSRKRCSTR